MAKTKQLPQTVREAVTELLKVMGDSNTDLIAGVGKDELSRFHHSWGRSIRNNFKLWGGNDELLRDTGKTHPDDASTVIMEAVWDALHVPEGTVKVEKEESA
jgi:hypothetical protein